MVAKFGGVATTGYVSYRTKNPNAVISIFANVLMQEPTRYIRWHVHIVFST